jgi:hypothetical protein
MGLTKYAIVFGLGYAVGHPDGRQKLRAVPAQVSELARRPEVEKVRVKGKAVADQAVQTAKQRLGRGGSGTTGESSTAGTAGTTTPAVVAEETVIVTETTGGKVPVPGTAPDVDTAMHGTLPPVEPVQGRPKSGPAR